MVQYVEWSTLQNRGPVDPAPDEPVEGILLVGTKPALEFYGNQSHCGEDSISIFPAIHKGERCWVKREVWCPSENYSASGTQEFIVPFEEGVKIFLERGVFEFPAPTSTESDQKERIKQFFEGVIVDGIERRVVFSEYSDDERLEVFLVAPPNASMNDVRLDFPLQEDQQEEYDGSNARPHVPSERVLAQREAASQRGPRPPRQ